MLWGQPIKVFTDHKNLKRDALGLNFGPSVPMKVIARRVRAQDCQHQRHTQYRCRCNLTAWYDPRVNQTAESYLMTKVKGNSRSIQKQNWLAVSKHWWELETDDTTKYEDWNLVFANHGEEDETYPLTIIEIAEAQKKD